MDGNKIKQRLFGAFATWSPSDFTLVAPASMCKLPKTFQPPLLAEWEKALERKLGEMWNLGIVPRVAKLGLTEHEN